MKHREKYSLFYGLVNIIVLLVTAVWFSCGGICFGTIRQTAVLLLTAIFVHGIKALRLYLAMFGKNIPLRRYMEQYCKTAVVSMILSFKLGDIFRAYCYGYYLCNYLGGAALIVLDRFTDTLALVTVMLVLRSAHVSGAVPLLYVLLAVLLGLLVCYMLFPSMHHYWKKYLLRINASRRRNRMLLFMEYAEYAYKQLEAAVRGRGFIAYILSLAAWAAETTGLAASGSMLSVRETGPALSEYLTVVLAGMGPAGQNPFVSVSVVFMAVCSLLLHVIRIGRKRMGWRK